MQQLEMRLERAGRPLHQQIERRLGRLELVAAILHFDDLLEHALHQRAILLQIRFARERNDIRPAGQLAHQHAARVADALGRDVLVAAGPRG